MRACAGRFRGRALISGPRNAIPHTVHTSRRVFANGLHHHVHEWPPDQAERGVVFALHGFQDAGSSFDRVAPSLAAEGMRVFAPDLRGYGQTERIGAGGYYHFPDYVFDIAELIDALSPDAPVFLVGHSMGGTVAAMLAGTLPERIALLALLEGIGPPEMPVDLAAERVRAWIEGVRKQRDRLEKPMTLDEAVRRLSINHPAVEKDIIRARATQLTREVEGGRVWCFDGLHRTQSPIAFSVDRFTAHLRRITAPTLVVGGGKSGFHPEDEAARIAAIPNAEHLEIDDAGHMMHWTRPEKVAAILVDFLRRGFGS